MTLIAVVLGDDKTGKLVDTTALFAYGYDQFHKTELSAQTIVQKAEEAGLSPDADAVQAEMILLPKDKKPSALTYTAQDDALLVDAGAGDPLLLEVPQDTVPTGAAQALSLIHILSAYLLPSQQCPLPSRQRHLRTGHDSARQSCVDHPY